MILNTSQTKVWSTIIKYNDNTYKNDLTTGACEEKEN